MIRRHDGFVPDNVRSRLQKVLEAVADDHPSAPLLSGLGPKGIDEAHAELVVLARACRTGTRSLLADEVVPTPKALAQRLCRLRGYGMDSIGVAITELTEVLCTDAPIEQIVEDGSRVVMLALAEALIGIAQLMAAPTGEVPSAMLAMLLDTARDRSAERPVERASGARDADARTIEGEEREAS